MNHANNKLAVDKYKKYVKYLLFWQNNETKCNNILVKGYMNHTVFLFLVINIIIKFKVCLEPISKGYKGYIPNF